MGEWGGGGKGGGRALQLSMQLIACGISSVRVTVVLNEAFADSPVLQMKGPVRRSSE